MKKSIKAEAHSDDRAIEVTFDAIKWFKKASGKEIQDLATCGFGGNYPADQVAIDMAGSNKELKRMFDYIEVAPGDQGFECHVDSANAVKWLRVNRPKIYHKVLKVLEERELS